MVVERLMEEKRRNLEIFKRLDEIAREIKDVATHFFGPCRVFIFGSALRGDWHPTLSDIDVAVVTNCEDMEKILRFKAEIARRWSIFELHVVDERIWNFYRRFIDDLREI